MIKTDPKNTDYRCESGAKRILELWHYGVGDEAETDEQCLVRLEKEEEMEEEPQDGMERLEAQAVNVRREVAVADALDKIQTHNERLDACRPEVNERRTREEEEDAAALARAREKEMEKLKIAKEDVVVDDDISLPLFTARRPRRIMKHPRAKGIILKTDKPRGLVDYDSEAEV